ncbi:MAG: TonB-dependent receptor plug domain-containing protein, partial [Bacteroidota bacterium]|nr:TonB-dependent receptor plug domain-containing protein [Bacteroidota bacterium]
MKKITTVFYLILIAKLSAIAQQSVKIKIIDLSDRRGLSNISFKVVRNDTIIYSGTTNNRGAAIINNIQPGYFTVSVDSTRDYLAFNERLELLSSTNKDIEIPLQRNRVNVLADVLVTDKINRINTKDATVSSVVTKREIEALPIEGRDITRSLYRLPNVTLSTLSYNEAPNISINGLSGIYTNYLIDGMDNNERFLGNVKFNTPFGFTENVTVLTNNYSAEFGNTSNGIVNVATRSGTNKFSGEVFYLTRPGSIIDSKSAFAGVDLYGNPVKDGFQRQQLGVGIGGAIKKDKTFYYLNFEQTFDTKDNLLTVPQLGVNETVRGRNKFSYFSGKIDQNWSNNFHSSLRANIGSFDIEQQGGGLTGGVLFPSAASTQKNRTYLIALKNDYKISDKIKGETNFQTSYFRWDYRDNPKFGEPGVSVQAPSGTLIASIGPSNYIFDDHEYTNQLQQKFRYTTGKHSFLAGAEFTTSDFKLLGAGNSNGFYTVRLTQAQMDA